MRYLDDTTENAVNAPYIYRGSALAPTWDYSAHAQLAYAVHSAGISGRMPPVREIEFSTAIVFKECVRQCSILALIRNPDVMFEDPHEDLKAYRKRGDETPTRRKMEISEAIERADLFASTYFSKGQTDLGVALEGHALVDELHSNRRDKTEMQALQGFMRQ